VTGGATSVPLLITRLQRQLEAVIRPLLPRGEPVALVGFPNYANVGDSAIWLGTLACLRALGSAAPRYVCDHATYTRERLAAGVGNGTILLHGGGSLGDLWPEHEGLREEVIAAFPANPIIQLPQAIHFQERVALAHARAVFDRHPRLTLLLRDQQSLTIARNEFRAPSVLCPDMAFCLGALPQQATARRRVLWLGRMDQESAAASRVPADAGIEPVDWLTEHAPLLWLARRLGSRRLLRVRGLRWLRTALPWTYDWAARQRLLRGCRLLSGGRVVVTDRLHGHILCVLLGIPHVLLDNSYRKVRSFHETWTRDCELVRWCESGSQALRLADGLS
jgi:exopolysaccharide biosynthesis predicted pyruvyltransferase EpsI